MKRFIFILCTFCLQSLYCFGQDEGWADCRLVIKDYNIYLQPKNIAVGLNEILSVNVVFDGKKDYILTFCSSKVYYPIHVRLLRSETKEELYDNASNNYSNSIGIAFSNTQSLIIEITLLANKLSRKERKSDINSKVYVGMFMHSKNISATTESKIK